MAISLEKTRLLRSTRNDHNHFLNRNLGGKYFLTEKVIRVILKKGHCARFSFKDRGIHEKASPRHVPAIILEMPEAPYTLNMKKVESVVTNIIHGRPVSNRDALMNPQVLYYFEKIASELQK